MTTDRPALATLLAGYRNTAVAQLATANGLEAEAGRMTKEQGVAVLAAHWRDPEGIRRRRAALDPAARVALDLAHQAGGRIARETLTEILVEDGVATAPATAKPRYGYGDPLPAAGNWSAAGSRAAQDVLARVEVAGLLLGQGAMGGSTVVDPGAAREYVIPSEIWAALPDPPPWPVPAPPELAREVLADAGAASRALFFLWSHLARHRPALLQTGRLGKRDLKGAAQALGLSVDVAAVKDEGELAQLFLARLQLQGLGLVAGRPGQAVICDTLAARELFALPLAERVLMLLEAYEEAEQFNELRYLPGVTWIPATRGELAEPAPRARIARHQVLAVLADLGDTGDWVGMAAPLRALRVRAREFLVPAGLPMRGGHGYWNRAAHRYAAGGNSWGWSFEGVKDEANGWGRVEGGFVRVVLEVLRSLGLVDLGLGPANDVVAYRLTAWGRYALTEAAPEPAEPDASGARLVVQPNFQVVALGPVPELMLLDLEQFADRVSSDRAVTYELNRASVYRGQQVGWDGERVVTWLAEASGADVPQNVERSVREWQGLHERIVVRGGVRLIQARDAALMDRLVAAVSTLERLTPTLALAPTSAIATVERALAELGESPWRLGPDAAPAAALTLDEAGRVRLHHKTPDLVTLGWLQRLADAEGPDWRVTAAAARRAHDRLGYSAEDQLARWTALCGTAPDWLAARLKAWTGHYGAANRVSGVVLELPSQAALDDLRAHADLRAALKPVRAKGPLVTIPAADYPRIAARLRELGLEVPEVDADA